MTTHEHARDGELPAPTAHYGHTHGVVPIHRVDDERPLGAEVVVRVNTAP
jgi:hypothetical protein